MFSSCRKTFVDSGNKTELHKKTTRKSKFLVSNRIRVYADITNVAYFILEVEIHHKTWLPEGKGMELDEIKTFVEAKFKKLFPRTNYVKAVVEEDEDWEGDEILDIIIVFDGIKKLGRLYT